MKDLYKRFLFSKHIMVHEANSENNWSKPVDADDFFPVLITLGQKFGIRINKHPELATMDMIQLASEELGVDVPAPFYRGFPHTVLELTPNQLLYDQLLHYTHTYGCGWFEEPGHSVIEGTIPHPETASFEQVAYNESVPAKDFIILPEEEATNSLKEAIRELMASNRPLNGNQSTIATAGWFDFGKDILPEWMACKDTVINFLYGTKDLSFCRYLKLSDVIKLLARIQHVTYLSDNLKKLNLKNQDRKFVTSVIDYIVKLDSESKKVYCDFAECFEKRKIWCGLLHHIHYRSNYETMKLFISDVRSNENHSVYSDVEALIKRNDVPAATETLLLRKGPSEVIRHLDYLLSRCHDEAEVKSILEMLSRENGQGKKFNPVVLIQLMLKYRERINDPKDCFMPRSFVFSRNNKLRVHKETSEEVAKRKSVVSLPKTMAALDSINTILKKSLRGRIDRVYIDPNMFKIAVPIDMANGESGFGVLPTGSRIKIPDGKFVRAFTYWEKVNDIDLSCFAINKNGDRQEFSWRNMYRQQGTDITYSGDQTSGYNGGSEYFDIDIDSFRENHSDFQYVVFCNNVYSGINFHDCECRAGFMVRGDQNVPCWKGERTAPINHGPIFDPKTVQTSFKINTESTFAHLFAIDLYTREMVWLNLARNDRVRVAGTTDMDFLLRYLTITDAFNVGTLYTYAANEVTSDPKNADVIASDKEPDPKVLFDNPDIEVVHSWDIEKMLRLLQP